MLRSQAQCICPISQQPWSARPSAAGKTFGVTTLLERSTTRAQDAWMGEIRRVPPDAERRVPWPEDLIETGA